MLRLLQLTLACFLCAACSEPVRPGDRDQSADSRATGDTGRTVDGPRAPDVRPATDHQPPDPDKTYWVSPTGAAVWSGCKGATPLAGSAACSLTTANASAVAGDTIVLRAGTYATGLAPARSGTATERITFRAHTGEVPRITGAAVGITLVSRSHVTVDGLTVDGCKLFADLQTADHVWILKSALINSSDTGGWPMGIKMYNNAHHNRLAGCTIGHSGYMTSSDDKGGVMNLGNWENATDDSGYNLIEDNTFYHGGHHIIEIASHHNVIRNNVFHNENWTACARASTGNLCGNRNVAVYRVERNGTWNVIEGNRLAFAGASIDDTSGSSGLSVRNPHTIVRRNLFYLCDGPGLHLYVDSTTKYEASKNYVYQNTFYKNGISPLSGSDKRYTFGMVFDNVAGNGAPLPIVGVSVKNNLFYSDTGGAIFFYYTDPTKQTVVGNFWKSVSGSNASGVFTPSLPAGANIASTADPLFADLSAQPTVANITKLDFHLKPGSPAIDKGVFLTTASAAGSGTALSVTDASYFIDGYGIVEGDQIQLEGQTQGARIVGIDYAQNRLTLDTSLTWKAGQGVALRYSGSSPDIGAHEAGAP